MNRNKKSFKVQNKDHIFNQTQNTSFIFSLRNSKLFFIFKTCKLLQGFFKKYHGFNYSVSDPYHFDADPDPDADPHP